MLPHTMLADAEYSRSRIHELKAHQRLVQQAVSHDHKAHNGPRYRLGGALIAAGTRLQGIAATLPEAPSLPEPAPTPRHGH